MRTLCALALACFLPAAAAQALSCETVPLEERIQDIMRTQTNPKSLFQTSPALGLGQLSKPTDPRCDGTDWTGSVTCEGLQTFTGTLFSTHGLTDVQHIPVRGMFYKTALAMADGDPFTYWRPWTDTPMLIAFDQPVNGPLRLTHIDACANSIMLPASPDLQEALTACHARRACPAPALAYLRSLNQSVF